MIKLVLLSASLFVLIGCHSGSRNSDTHLGKFDWQKQLAEAQKNQDYGSCQDVVIAAFLDKNVSVVNKAADICWPIGANDPSLALAWSNNDISTKEEYLDMVGKSLDITLDLNEEK